MKTIFTSIILFLLLNMKAQVTSYTYNFSSPVVVDTLDVGDTLVIRCGSSPYTSLESMTTVNSAVVSVNQSLNSGNPPTTYTYSEGLRLETYFTNQTANDNPGDNRLIILNPCQLQKITVKRYVGGSTFNYIDFFIRSNGATAMKETKNEPNVIIYPNPVANEVKIESKERKTFIVCIYSQLGEVVLKERYVESYKVLDIESLTKGAYTIEVTIDNKKLIQKIIKL